MFKSMNGGVNWVPINTGLSNTFVTSLAIRNSVLGGFATSILDIAIDPVNSATVYASGDRAVYKTTDGGANWVPITFVPARVAAPIVRGIIIDPINTANSVCRNKHRRVQVHKRRC